MNAPLKLRDVIMKGQRFQGRKQSYFVGSQDHSPKIYGGAVLNAQKATVSLIQVRIAFLY